MSIVIQEEIQKGNIDSVKELINKNGIPSNSNWTDYYLLKTAIRYKQKEIVKYFLKKNFRVNKSYKKSKDSTPLHLAIKLGCPEIIKLLLSKGASITVKNNNNETPLILAAIMGKNDLIDHMLSVTSHENCYNEEGLSHIHIACMRNNVDLVKKFLQNGTEVNYIVKFSSYFWPGYTPLHFAVQYQCVETVELLISCNANLTAKNSNGLTPLHLAFKNQNETIIDLILSAHNYVHLNENPENSEGLSHFHIACTRNNPNIVENFIQRGVDIDRFTCLDASNWDFYSPLCFAIEFECVDVVRILLSYKPKLCGVIIGRAYEKSNEVINKLIFSNNKIENTDTFKKSLAFKYIQDNKDESRKLCDKELLLLSTSVIFNPNVNAVDQFGSTSLHVAVETQLKDAVKSLLQAGADITAKNNRGKTALHIAFENKNIEIMDLILSMHSNVKQNPSDSKGLTHFHIACTRYNLTIIKDFIKHGVDINNSVSLESSFWPGYTALHFACNFALSNVVTVLLENGADIMVKNGLGLTPLELTFKKGKFWWADELNFRFLEIFESILLVRESRTDSFINNGLSVLHLACAKDDIDTVKTLLNSRTINQQVYLPNWCGRTPLHFATSFNSQRVIEYLLEQGADVTIEDAEGNTALDLGLQRNDGIVTRKMFIPSEKLLFYNGNISSDAGLFHFYMACRLSYSDVVEYFLNRGIDVNQLISARRVYSSDKVCTPLQVLLKNDSCEEFLIKLLLKSGADLNKADMLMETPLHNVIFSSNSRILKFLLKEGADPNRQNIFGETPLHLLCKRIIDPNDLTNVTNIINTLLDYGTDVNIENAEGDTPLMVYAQDFNEKLPLIVVLMKHIRKLQIIGSHISDKNKRCYRELLIKCEKSNNFKETDFVQKCTNELDRMREVKLDNYTTLRDIIFKESNKLALHVENVKFQEIERDTDDIKTKFPIFGFIFALKFKEGLARRSLLEFSKVSLKLACGRELDDACLENIIRYLSNEDLKNVIKSIVPLQVTRNFKAVKNCPFLSKIKDIL